MPCSVSLAAMSTHSCYSCSRPEALAHSTGAASPPSRARQVPAAASPSSRLRSPDRSGAGLRSRRGAAAAAAPAGPALIQNDDILAVAMPSPPRGRPRTAVPLTPPPISSTRSPSATTQEGRGRSSSRGASPTAAASPGARRGRPRGSSKAGRDHREEAEDAAQRTDDHPCSDVPTPLIPSVGSGAPVRMVPQLSRLHNALNAVLMVAVALPALLYGAALARGWGGPQDTPQAAALAAGMPRPLSAAWWLAVGYHR